MRTKNPAYKRICRNERKFKDGVHACCLDRGHAGSHMSATARQWIRNFSAQNTQSLEKAI